MTIYLNEMPESLPSDFMTISNLLKYKAIKSEGTAVALNDKIVKKAKWDVTSLSDLDRVTIISAAFGG